jgi:wee1-like protein kinase
MMNDSPKGRIVKTPTPSPTNNPSSKSNRKRNLLGTSLSVPEELCSGEAMDVSSKKIGHHHEESDTDIGTDTGEVFDSDCEGDVGGENKSSPAEMISTKVRRLELSGARGHMDVKKSLFSPGGRRYCPASRSRCPTKTIRAPSSPPQTAHRVALVLPPTTTKKRIGGLGGIYCETDEYKRESSDDISPRDAYDFPFFADSSMSISEEKKPSRLMKSPPRRHFHQRANSFLQMFSQESVMESEGVDEDDDFLHRPSRPTKDEEYSISSPKRTIRNRMAPLRGDLPPVAPMRSSPFSRFAADFEVVGTLGNGAFGCVYKVRNRMDLRLYAIKAAKREARGKSDRDRMLQEVYALAALSDQTSAGAMHIVRYHQAWMEGNRLYIQTELCQSTLMDEVSEGVMNEKRLYKLLREILLALDCVHQSGMIHLDIKPENIFIKNDQYKLGDFGLVSKIENHSDVEEGDSRYMSMELLSGDLEDLTKSDIFSLGATLYEICLGRGLPENGQEWQDIRQGVLLPMRNTSFDFQMIVQTMMSPDKGDRPTASELLKRRQLLSEEQRQLIVERNKAEAANMALNAQMKLMKASPRKALARSNTIC